MSLLRSSARPLTTPPKKMLHSRWINGLTLSTVPRLHSKLYICVCACACLEGQEDDTCEKKRSNVLVYTPKKSINTSHILLRHMDTNTCTRLTIHFSALSRFHQHAGIYTCKHKQAVNPDMGHGGSL